jgi:hypothetical protein
MRKLKFSINKADPEMMKLIENCDKKVLAEWAIVCAKRVLPYFKTECPYDLRPQEALVTLKDWIKTGKFSMEFIRKASLDSHRAAKEIGNVTPGASVAHACGQAVATAHVARHAYGSAIYAQQAIFRKTNSVEKADDERNWQYKKLLSFLNN